MQRRSGTSGPALRPDGSLTINNGTLAVGSKEITAAAKAFMDAFPDLTVLFDDLREGSNGWEYHWTLDGTHVQTGITFG